MQTSINLRQLYTPIQPTVRQTAEQQVSYREFLPCAELQPFVYCYWRLHTAQPLAEPFYYRVVADGCIDVFFELRSTHENFVMGFCKKYTEFPLANDFDYVGIRFLPTVFPQIFKVNAADISDRFEALDAVAPELAQFIAENFHSELSEQKICGFFDAYLTQRIARADLDFDGRLYEALEVILQKQGMLNVETDLKTGFSPRQLRRVFEFYIGDTAKTFSKVVRFQHILRAKPSVQSLRQNKLFFDAGYYDQAHFIKEFKNFYGVTPSKAFGR